MASAGIPVSASDIEADGHIHRIHVQGDRKGSRNAWYVLHIDERPAGAFGCNKRLGPDARVSWTAKKTQKLTTDERMELRRRAAEAKVRREAEQRQAADEAAVRAQALWEAAQPCESHPYLERKRVQSHGLRIGRWEVVLRETGEVRVVSEQALFVSMRDKSRTIRSLQVIFPSADNMLHRDKHFLPGGSKRGNYYPIGKPITDTILIGEGYATCASAHEATGHAAIVAFDCGNLQVVAEQVRAAFPGHRIVLLADNDRWSKVGQIENPGLHHARLAAAAVRGIVALPEFASLDGKPKDFNDLHVREGLDVVARQIAEAINPPAPPAPAEPEAAVEDLPVGLPVDEAGVDPHGDDEPLDEAPSHFAVLGYDHEKYYFFQLEKQQLVVYTKGDFTEPGLIALAPLNWWELRFPGDKGGIEKKAAMDWLVRSCHRAGIYDDTRLRGRGAWIDAGRVVYHHGNVLTVDGDRLPITRMKSRYVYELQKALPQPADVPLSDEDGARLVEIAKMFRWTKSGSAALLAGWVALAPLCGALRWRPHIWVTGGAGSGKTTVLERFVHPLMCGHEVYAQGNSSEAGIRQTLRSDALPVLFDESEQNDDRETARMQAVLALIRQASSESNAKTLKGSAGGEAISFHVRSMFCLSSIQVGIRHQADAERLTKLALQPKHLDRNAGDTWQRIQDVLYALERDPDLPPRLLRRSLDLLPITRQNVDVFVRVAAQEFGTQREGDQYGTLLAGCWSLTSRAVATPEQAREMIRSYDWSEHVEAQEQDDTDLAMTALLEAHIKLPAGQTLTVADLARLAMGQVIEGYDMHSLSADAVLQRYGMRVKDGRLLLSNRSQQLPQLVEGTPYATDLRGVLLRYPGADRFGNRTVRFNGLESKCISVPLSMLSDEDPVAPARQSPRRDFEAF